MIRKSIRFILRWCHIKVKKYTVTRQLDKKYTNSPSEIIPPHCVRAGKEDQGENCVEKPLHWVVVMAKVDRLGPNGEFYNNRFNDGKCDSMGRLWAGS